MVWKYPVWNFAPIGPGVGPISSHTRNGALVQRFTNGSSMRLFSMMTCIHDSASAPSVCGYSGCQMSDSRPRLVKRGSTVMK